jgi:hypothetical protein
MLIIKIIAILFIITTALLRCAALLVYATEPPAWMRKLILIGSMPYMLAGVIAVDWLVDMTAAMTHSEIPPGLGAVLERAGLVLSVQNLETLHIAGMMAFAMITLALNRFEKRFVPQGRRRGR